MEANPPKCDKPDELNKISNEENKDAQSDREILESIEEDYFKDVSFDPSLYELKVTKNPFPFNFNFLRCKNCCYVTLNYAVDFLYLSEMYE